MPIGFALAGSVSIYRPNDLRVACDALWLSASCTMTTPPKRPNVLIGLGVAFLALCAIAVPMLVGDPTGSTGRGLPMWFAVPVLGIAGVGFIVYGAYWRTRNRGDSPARDTRE